MTVPVKPFADVLDQPGLYDETRRRAKARRSRRTAVASAVLALVAGVGTMTVTGAGKGSAGPADSVSQGEPLAQFLPGFGRNPIKDDDLAAMATGCPGECSVLARVDYTEGRTAALVGTASNAREVSGTPWSWVLAKGDSKVDEVADRSPITTDGSRLAFRGASILRGHQGAGFVFVTLAVRGTELDLTNGGFHDAEIVSDVDFGDVIDPILYNTPKILAGHEEDGRWSYTRWSWTGARWQPDTCQPDFEKLTKDDGKPPCFARHYPDQPSWVADVGCGRDNCWVDGPVTFANGDKLAALYADGPSKLVLMRDGTVIDTLPDGRFGGGLPKDLVIDKTGHALLRLTDHDERRSWVLPLADLDGRLAVIQGGYESGHALEGNEGTQIVDLDGDGVMEVLTTNDEAVTTYRWSGTHYITTEPPTSSWTSQVKGCAQLCIETQHVSLANGETVSVLKGQVEGRYKLVLRRGEQVLSALPPLGFADGYASELYSAGSGRVLLRVGGGATATFVQPFSTTGDELELIQGAFNAPDMSGDNSTEVKDTNGDGVLDVVVTEHAYAGPTEPYKLSATTWQWNGSRYSPTGCTGALC